MESRSSSSNRESLISQDQLWAPIQKQTSEETSEGKKVAKCQKPISIVLIILGITGVGVAGIGLVGFGGQSGWWAAGGLSNLSQVQALVMLAAGGGGGVVFIAIGSVGCLKSHKKDVAENEPAEKENKYAHLIDEEAIRDRTNLAKLDQLLEEDEWTCVLQRDGNYAIVVKHPSLEGTSKHLQGDLSSRVEEMENDIPPSKLQKAGNQINDHYYFRETSKLPSGIHF